MFSRDPPRKDEIGPEREHSPQGLVYPPSVGLPPPSLQGIVVAIVSNRKKKLEGRCRVRSSFRTGVGGRNVRDPRVPLGDIQRGFPSSRFAELRKGRSPCDPPMELIPQIPMNKTWKTIVTQMHCNYCWWLELQGLPSHCSSSEQSRLDVSYCLHVARYCAGDDRWSDKCCNAVV